MKMPELRRITCAIAMRSVDIGAQLYPQKAYAWVVGRQLSLSRDLLAPNDTVSFAFTNNNVGQAVGMSGLCSNVLLPPFIQGTTATHAVLWDVDGTVHDLGSGRNGVG